MTPRLVRRCFLCLFALSVLVVCGRGSPTFAEGAGHFTGIERVEVQSPGSTRLDVGLQGEPGRQLSANVEYDNLRLHPVGVHYGLTERFELGASLGASFNSGDVEEDDVEFVSLLGKYRWNRFLAISLGATLGVGERVFPYGGDGLGMDLNVPVEYPFGPGRLIAQLGYRVNRGTVTPTIAWDNYLRYGVGYAYEMTRRFEVVVELDGHGPTVDLPGTAEKKDQDLSFLAHYKPDRTSTVTPRIQVGLQDGSPDAALGLGYRLEFGVPEPARVPYRDTAPVDITPDTRSRQPILSPERSSDPRGRLLERARRAYERGDLQEAITLYERVRQRGAAGANVLSNLGSLYFRRGNYARARDRYREALQETPDNYHSHLYLGITYERLGNRDRARTHYRRALDLRPETTEARRRLENLSAGSDTAPRP